MKNFYLILIRLFLFIQAFLFLLSIEINAQTFTWAKSISDSESIVINGITVDVEGNSYIIGRFQKTAIFDTIKLTSYGSNSGYYDIFIAKYNQDGNCLWAKQAGGFSYDEGYGISVNANGYIFITGEFIGPATFDTIQLAGFGGSDVANIFVAKYDPNGNCLWAKQAGSIGSSVGNSISIDQNGNSYITGWFIGTAIFDSIQLSGYGWDIYLAKYDPDGNCLWAKHAGSGSNTHHIGYSVSVDLNGASYITGRFEGNAIFDTIQLAAYGSNDIFIAKYDPNGNCLWAKHSGGTSSDAGNGISVDTTGNSYITGTFTGSAIFDTIQLAAYGSNDIFIAKYDPNGNCLWAKHSGGASSDAGKSISVNPDGNSYMTGYFTGSATFDTTTLNSIGDNDMFITKFDPNGNCLWIKHAGGTGLAVGSCISVVANRDIYVAGWFVGTANFGTIQLSVDLYGAFITKLSDTPLPVELTSFTYKTIGSSIKLDWITQTEINNFRFEVERKNQNSNWLKIAELKGAGNSSSPMKYSFFDKSLACGDYYYRLKQIDYNGLYKYSNTLEVILNSTPKNYLLENNFPNPFNPSTIITYSLPFDSNVKLTIFNSLGQVIKELISEFQKSGYYEVNFNASEFPSGVYFYSFHASSIDGRQGYLATKKMLLLK